MSDGQTILGWALAAVGGVVASVTTFVATRLWWRAAGERDAANARELRLTAVEERRLPAIEERLSDTAHELDAVKASALSEADIDRCVTGAIERHLEKRDREHDRRRAEWDDTLTLRIEAAVRRGIDAHDDRVRSSLLRIAREAAREEIDKREGRG